MHIACLSTVALPPYMPIACLSTVALPPYMHMACFSTVALPPYMRTALYPHTLAQTPPCTLMPWLKHHPAPSYSYSNPALHPHTLHHHTLTQAMTRALKPCAVLTLHTLTQAMPRTCTLTQAMPCTLTHGFWWPACAGGFAILAALVFFLVYRRRKSDAKAVEKRWVVARPGAPGGGGRAGMAPASCGKVDSALWVSVCCFRAIF